MTPAQADRTAAQIMVVAFAGAEAREQIAQILMLTYAQGQLAGIEEAKQVVGEAFANQGSAA